MNIKKPTTPTYEGLESGDTSILNGDTEEEECKNKYLTMTGKIYTNLNFHSVLIYIIYRYDKTWKKERTVY